MTEKERNILSKYIDLPEGPYIGKDDIKKIYKKIRGGKLYAGNHNDNLDAIQTINALYDERYNQFAWVEDPTWQKTYSVTKNQK